MLTPVQSKLAEFNTKVIGGVVKKPRVDRTIERERNASICVESLRLT
jgi:hypothetical protein